MASVMRELRLRNLRIRIEKACLIDFVVNEMETNCCHPPVDDSIRTGIQNLRIHKLLETLSAGTFMVTSTKAKLDLSEVIHPKPEFSDCVCDSVHEEVERRCMQTLGGRIVDAAFEVFLLLSDAPLAANAVSKHVCMHLGITSTQYHLLARHTRVHSLDSEQPGANVSNSNSCSQSLSAHQSALAIIYRRRDAITTVFEECDKFHEGYLHETEFCKSLQVLGIDTSSLLLQQILRSCRRKNGMIDFDAFLQSLELQPKAAECTDVDRCRPVAASGSGRQTAAARNSIEYRMKMIAHSRPINFDTAAEHKRWLILQTRVVAVALDCVMAKIVAQRSHASAASFQSVEFDGIRIMLNAMLNELVEIGCRTKSLPSQPGSTFAVDEFLSCTERIRSFVQKVAVELSCGPAEVAHAGAGMVGLRYEFPLNTLLYEILVGTAFDSEEKGRLVPNHEEIFRSLSTVRRGLFISGDMHYISLLRIVFQDMKDQDILTCHENSISLLRTYAQLLTPMEGLAQARRNTNAEFEYRKAVLTQVVDFCRRCFHGIKWTADAMEIRGHIVRMQSLMEAYLAIEMAVAPVNLSTVVKSLVVVIAHQFYSEIIDESDISSNLSIELVITIATRAVDCAAQIVSLCTELFPSYCNEASRHALSALVQFLKRDYEVCNPPARLDPDVIRCLRVFKDLEMVFRGFFDNSSDISSDWDFPIAECGSPFVNLVVQWIEKQKIMFDESISTSRRHNSAAQELLPVADICSIFSQSIQFLDSLRLSGEVWVQCLLRLVEAIVQAVCQYTVHACTMTTENVPCDEIPPIPDIRLPLKKIKFPRTGRSTAVRKPPEDAGMLEGVCCRLHNLQGFSREVEQLQTQLRSAWARENSRTQLAAEGRKRLDHLLSSVCRLFMTTHAQLLELLASKAVYGDLRTIFIDALYIPCAQGHRFAHIRSELEKIIGIIQDSVPPALVCEVIREVRQVFLCGFERVLLNGGPNRVFDIDDYPFIQQDYIQVLAFFAQHVDRVDILEFNPQLCADSLCGRCEQNFAVCCSAVGGLMCRECSKIVHQGRWKDHHICFFASDVASERLRHVVQLFGLPSRALMDSLRPSSPATSNDARTVCCVLAHRLDGHDAAKSFLSQVGSKDLDTMAI
eukprot:SAG11_NODE_14_length_26344_cov_14.209411_13_plen_1135_part_00